jgi:hypothetical protein
MFKNSMVDYIKSKLEKFKIDHVEENFIIRCPLLYRLCLSLILLNLLIFLDTSQETTETFLYIIFK